MKFKDFLFEQREKHAVMAFGRLNPPTLGHEKLVNKVKSIAQKVLFLAYIVELQVVFDLVVSLNHI